MRTGPLEPDLDHDRQPTALPSNRFFGLVFAFLFAGLGIYLLWKQGTTLWFSHGFEGTLRWLWEQSASGWLLLGVAALFLFLLVLWPDGLTPLNRLWTAFGRGLHRFVSPVVLGLMFFGVFWPMGLFMRLIGKPPLKPRPRHSTSYWQPRDPPGPDGESLCHPY